MQNMISIQNISKTFDGKKFILKNLSLDIKKCDFCILTGPNGSGKTTFLKIIKQLILPTSGDIVFEESFDTDKVELISQNPRSFFLNLSIYENLDFFCGLKKINLLKIDHELNHLLSIFKLKDKFFHKVTNLSSGEMKKLSIIRSLVSNPSVLLFDEATSYLDVDAKTELISYLTSDSFLKKEIATIWVTHDKNEIKQFHDPKELIFNKEK